MRRHFALAGVLLLASACTPHAPPQAAPGVVDGFGELNFDMSPVQVRELLARRGGEVLVDSGLFAGFRIFWLDLRPPLAEPIGFAYAAFDKERLKELRVEYHGGDSSSLPAAGCHALFAKVMDDLRRKYRTAGDTQDTEHDGVRSTRVTWRSSAGFAIARQDFDPSRDICYVVDATLFGGDQAAFDALEARLSQVTGRQPDHP